MHFPARLGKLLPSIDVGEPHARPAVLGILDENVPIQSQKRGPRFLQESGAEFLFGLGILQVHVGAAITAEEAREFLGGFVAFQRPADLEVRAVGQVGVGDEQETGLVAAGVAVAEGQRERQVALVDLEGAVYLPACAGEAQGADVFGFGHG